MPSAYRAEVATRLFDGLVDNAEWFRIAGEHNVADVRRSGGLVSIRLVSSRRTTSLEKLPAASDTALEA